MKAKLLLLSWITVWLFVIIFSISVGISCRHCDTGNLLITNRSDYDVTISIGTPGAVIVTSYPLLRRESVNYSFPMGTILLWVQMTDGSWHQNILQIGCKIQSFAVVNGIVKSK
jgi:cation transport ATPase